MKDICERVAFLVDTDQPCVVVYKSKEMAAEATVQSCQMEAGDLLDIMFAMPEPIS